MKLEVKNVKMLQTRNGYAFTGTLYVDGIKAALVEQSGNGGSNSYDWRVGPDKSFHGGPFAKSVWDYVASLPPEMVLGALLSVDLDTLVERAMNEQERLVQYRRWCKKNTKTVWRTPDMKDEQWKINNSAFTPEFAAKIRAQHPDAIFANELI